MSVTFFIESPQTDQFRAACELTGELARGSYAQVEAAINAHPWQDCDGCIGYRPSSSMVTDLPENCEVNLANGNALRMLRLLGLAQGGLDLTGEISAFLVGLVEQLPSMEADSDPYELVGELPGEQFLARVQLALALEVDDAQVPAVQLGRMVVAGNREGYICSTLERLHALALLAWQLGRKVLWS